MRQRPFSTVAVAATGGGVISVHLNARCRDIKWLLRLLKDRYLLEKNNLRKFKHYLSKSILSNGLESLFNVDGLLSAGLKVGDLILGLTPGLGPLSRHGSVVQIDLVAQDNKGEVVRVSGACLQ